MIGLPYPGGPLVDQLTKDGDSLRFKFPEPKVSGLDFSFSGLKTSILYFLQNAGKSNLYKEEFAATNTEKEAFISENLPDICASIQYRIVTILINKLVKASEETGIKNICISGGVSANSGLRAEFKKAGNKNGWSTFIPAISYCTDNAGMIAITAYFKFKEGQFADLSESTSA